ALRAQHATECVRVRTILGPRGFADLCGRGLENLRALERLRLGQGEVGLRVRVVPDLRWLDREPGGGAIEGRARVVVNQPCRRDQAEDAEESGNSPAARASPLRIDGTCPMADGEQGGDAAQVRGMPGTPAKI